VIHFTGSHHPASPPSVTALNLLRSALSSSYPSNKPGSPPLIFDLEVVESTPPTPDQLGIILSYLPSKSSNTPSLSTFISSHPAAPTGIQSAERLVNEANKNPNVFKYPIVVDWTGGKAAVGDVDGVKSILEAIRQKRDGEVKDED
jgi:hypothetical protein